jgi:hypothetical protein
MSKFVKNAHLQEDVGPGSRGRVAAAESLTAKRLLTLSTSGVAKAGVGDTDIVGISVNGDAGDSATHELTSVLYNGEAEVTAGTYIKKGDLIKAGPLGLAVPALTSNYAGDNFASAITGLAFGNQPTNDGVEVVSSSAADTTSVTIYGTTTGTLTVVSETVVLTGTTAVSTEKTDWGVVLGFEIPRGKPLAAGTITVREASGNATISTLTAGNRQKGVQNVAATSVRNAYGHPFVAIASGATTKTVGVVGVDPTGDVAKAAVALAGTAGVRAIGNFGLITKLLFGDVEADRTVTFKVDTILDVASLIVGRAKADVDPGDDVLILKDKINLSAETRKDFQSMSVQTIDMASTQVTLVLEDPEETGELKLVGQLLFVDANSNGTEDLVLPAEDESTGLWLIIVNTGGESIVVKNSADDATVVTVATTEISMVACDGTTWKGGMMSPIAPA